MYLRSLKLEHVKLVDNLDLTFNEPGDEARYAPWTVLIGPNGTAKTTILQCIALAAAGSYHAPGIANGLTARLRDLRAPHATTRIRAEFSFSDLAIAGASEVLRDLALPPVLTSELRLCAELTLPEKKSGFDARSWYEVDAQRTSPVALDPLRDARTDAPSRRLWFVAGYGIHRNLPLVIDNERRDPPGVESRLDSLFRPRALTSLEWANVFHAKQEANATDLDANAKDLDANAKDYKRALKDALIREFERLLPRIDDLVLRGGPRKSTPPGDSLQSGDRFRWRLGDDGKTLPIAATSLSHGYQSTIAWVSDLVGQVLHESAEPILPSEMRGLVLVDELDLYLHPRWQVRIIRAIQEIFPKLQFVVTTHSPLLLPSLRPLIDQVVMLDFKPEDGSVVRIEEDADPRLLTSGQILRSYFGLDEIFDDDARRLIAEYQSLAVDPDRSPAEEAHLDALEQELEASKLVAGVVRVPRLP